MMVDMSQRPDCPPLEVARDYAVDRLSAEQAEEFEAHYFGCNACWGHVQRAIEIRAATGEANRDGRTRIAAWRGVLAVAASLVLVAAAVAVWTTRPGPGRVTRGGQELFAARVVTRDGVVAASWPAVEGARGYRGAVFTVEGTRLLEWETDMTEHELDLSALSLPPDAELYLRVQAVDPLGQILDSTGLVAVRPSGEDGAP